MSHSPKRHHAEPAARQPPECRAYENTETRNVRKPDKPPIEIMAHETAVNCMALSNEGSKLATSSLKVNRILKKLSF